jgi:glycosyltransferase involved in cell wall biosynthesis
MRPLFLIRSLDTGGAERQLVQLALSLAERDIEVGIATMYGGGALEGELSRRQNVSLFDLRKKGRSDVGPFLVRAYSVAKSFKPDLVHGYMSGANELALALGTVLRVPTAWGIRVSDQHFDEYSTFREAVFRVGVLLSRFPSLIVANSFAGRAFHVGRGYPASRFIVIPNGIDVARFRPDSEAGRRWRDMHRIRDGEHLISLPARLDPMKDHSTFLAAARIALKMQPDLKFLAVGRGSEAETSALRARISAEGLENAVGLIPSEQRVEDLYNASDVVTLTSAFGEGFPNVIGEAMACGRRCISTAAGDASVVIGEAGVVVPIREPDALAAAWVAMIRQSPAQRQLLEAKAQQRIHEHFTIEMLTTETIRRLDKLVARQR